VLSNDKKGIVQKDLVDIQKVGKEYLKEEEINQDRNHQ